MEKVRNYLFTYTRDRTNLSSGTRFDEAGGTFIGGNGKCILKDSRGRIVGKGNKVGRLYLMDAHSQIQEHTNFSTTTQKQTWDQWHKMLWTIFQACTRVRY